MKYYSKNQIGIILIIVCGIFYSKYLDNKYYDTISRGSIFISTVIKQYCRNSSRRSSSSVSIIEHNKEYTVKLSSKICQNYPVNKSIKVYYNKDNDEFVFKVQEYHGKNRLIFLYGLLLISFLPWSFWITKLEKRKKLR